MTLFKWGTSSFGFSFFKWFFSANGDKCGGWDAFPTLGLQALKWTWSYDFSLTYIGVGARASHACFISERPGMSLAMQTSASHMNRGHCLDSRPASHAGGKPGLLYLCCSPSP